MALIDYHRIGVPVGTRLQALMRVERGWMVWTAFNKASVPEQWLGTYLLLGDDGSVQKITIREDGGEDIWLIRPADDA